MEWIITLILLHLMCVLCYTAINNNKQMINLKNMKKKADLYKENLNIDLAIIQEKWEKQLEHQRDQYEEQSKWWKKYTEDTY